MRDMIVGGIIGALIAMAIAHYLGPIIAIGYLGFLNEFKRGRLER